MNKIKKITALLFLSISIVCGAAQREPMVIAEQGSFMPGGVVLKNSQGDTLHGDHAYVFYQIPENSRKYPLVFVHGIGQFSKTWETTPDGREGFQNIFLRRKFTTYVLDLPRRGNAGRGTEGVTITPKFEEALWFNRFRLGIYPEFFDGVQIKEDEETMNQFMRQMTPDTGPLDLEAASDSIAALLNQIKPSILVTHSLGGPVGWKSILKSENIKAVAAYEPGGYFPFPEGENPLPEAEKLEDTSGVEGPKGGYSESIEIPKSEFMKYTKIPIIIYYGDYLPPVPSGNIEQDFWRLRLDLARKWAEVVNENGGDVQVVHLPDLEIYGNTHFPFSDLNNLEIADLLSEFLAEKNMD